ncbi:hypothetical protein TYRP_008222 [Tyrophagus putrescentiae]|nr:hypothetical protein TYRP_008222 [Tyrophagus putrescentiae]
MMPESSSAFAVHKDGSKVDDNSNDESPSDGEVSFRKFVRQLVKNFLPSGSKKNLKEVQNEEQIVEESESDDYGHSPTFSELFALNTAKEEKSPSSESNQSLSEDHFSSAISLKPVNENFGENEEHSNSSTFDRHDFSVDDDDYEEDKNDSDELEMSTAHSISSFTNDLMVVRKQSQLIRRFRDRLQIQASSEDKKDGKWISPASAEQHSELKTSAKIIAVYGPGGTLLQVSPDLDEKETQEVDREQKLKQEDNFVSAAGDD